MSRDPLNGSLAGRAPALSTSLARPCRRRALQTVILAAGQWELRRAGMMRTSNNAHRNEHREPGGQGPRAARTAAALATPVAQRQTVTTQERLGTLCLQPASLRRRALSITCCGAAIGRRRLYRPASCSPARHRKIPSNFERPSLTAPKLGSSGRWRRSDCRKGRPSPQQAQA